MEALSGFLSEHSELWQFPSFSALDLPWRDSSPALCAWLDELSAAEVSDLRANPSALAEAMARWVKVPDFEPSRLVKERSFSRDARFFRRIGGRKAAQISGFCERVGDLGLPYLEWCSGKGHLSRALISDAGAGRATCVEIEPELCAAGESQVGERAIRFACADALEPESRRYVERDQQALALHACGALHVRLLQAALEAETEALVVAPCCFHKIDSSEPTPLSERGRASGLSLTRNDLRTAVQESVVASAASRRRRVRELRYRLGFDLLQREIRQSDTYLPVPRPRAAVMEAGFEAFCRWASGQREVGLGRLGELDWEQWEQWERCGAERVEVIDRIEAVRDVFRRPIELWLVQDRAAWLQEAGYLVEVGTFCEREVTPRNLMIRASRGGR